MKRKRAKRKRERVAIIFDGKKWHIRQIRAIEHDLIHDEKVYRCDKPLANDLGSIAEIVAWLHVNWGQS